ncbi:GNAT family N-acetyltransferase [Bacillus sp. FJAT-22090]|uniref:GNAT family N-acetyltransferase n=1 Tax=Bacillus sp. FJAT-22090 TaxID=1581038 RepID=UPI00119DC4D4|nr:GNAT family N-acetyltransferase [Bacillus sp. FJAT-22090]
MSWKLMQYKELDTNLLYKILKLRVDVFVVEQNCAYPELDGYDQNSFHCLYLEEGEVLAYCRILPPGEKYDICSIGRVIVNERARGKGFARQLMVRAIESAKKEWNVTSIKICAQSHLQEFYRSLGFETVSEEFDEDGIPHVYMILYEK